MTKNALEAQKLKEEQRHNKEQEEIERYGKRTDRKKYVAQTVQKGIDQGAEIGGKIIGGIMKAAGNSLNWYTFFTDMINSQLKQSIDSYSGVTIAMDNNTAQLGINVFLPGAPKRVTEFKQNIVSYNFIPTIGAVDELGPTTAEASKNFNTIVRGDNSGGTNYDGIDLFKYPLAIDSPVFILQWLLRGISLVNYKDARDPSTVQYSLLKAHCDSRANLMEMFLTRRSTLVDLYNDIVLSLNTLNIPFEIPFVQRHAWLCSVVFTTNDSNGSVARNYQIVNPDSYFVYNESSGSLECYVFFDNFTSGMSADQCVNKLRSIMNDMVQPLTNSQAMGTMSGDIKKAFGDGVKYPYFSLDQLSKLAVYFETDTKYLQSFKNAEICCPYTKSAGKYPDFSINEGIDVNTDPFLYQGTYNNLTHIWKGPRLEFLSAQFATGTDESLDNLHYWHNLDYAEIDYYDDASITEEDQCYNLSFVNVYEVENDNVLYLRSSRSEILTRMSVFTYTQGSSSSNRISQVELSLNSNFYNNIATPNNTIDLDDSDHLDGVALLNAMQSFEFLPKVYWILSISTDDTNEVILYWNRNHNRNQVRRYLIRGIQRSALLSMFMPASKEETYTRSKDNNTKRTHRRR